MPESFKVTSVASTSVAHSEIDGPMDTVKEALDTCNYLMSQSWVDHYPVSKTRPYINLGLHNIALETCCSLLEMTIHNIQQEFSDTTDHWYLIWYILSTIIGLFMTACILNSVWVHILPKKLKIMRKSKENITRDRKVCEREITTRKNIACTSNTTWAHRVESMKTQDPQQNPEQ